MTDQSLFARVDLYIEQLYGGDDPILAATAASPAEADLPNIAVSPVQGRLLHFLVRLTGARRILELGTLAGYSTIWLARALPPGGRLVSIEASPKHLAVARDNLALAGLLDVVELRQGRGLDVLAALESEAAEPFDVVFIDADKPPLAEYLEAAIRLSRSGTLIIVDNVIREGRVMAGHDDDDRIAGVRRFNQALSRHPALHSVILQTVGRKSHDGLALALVR